MDYQYSCILFDKFELGTTSFSEDFDWSKDVSGLDYTNIQEIRRPEPTIIPDLPDVSFSKDLTKTLKFYYETDAANMVNLILKEALKLSNLPIVFEINPKENLGDFDKVLKHAVLSIYKKRRNHPVFGTVTNGENWYFFAIDNDVVYSGGNIIEIGFDKYCNSTGLKIVLQWLLWIINVQKDEKKKIFIN